MDFLSQSIVVFRRFSLDQADNLVGRQLDQAGHCFTIGHIAISVIHATNRTGEFVKPAEYRPAVMPSQNRWI